MSERNWLTKGQIPGRNPDVNLYDIDYFAGRKKSSGVQFPEDGSYLDPNSPYRNKFRDTLRWITKFTPKGKILDVGSGPTHLTHWARELNLPLSIVSCDLSQSILSWAMENNGATPVVSTGHQLPFKTAIFNGVLFADVLEHMWPEDVQRAIQEAIRILSPGGFIFINIPNRVTWNDAARKDTGHVWLPTIKEMKKLLTITGFNHKTIRYFTRGFPISNKVRTIIDSDLRLPFFGRSIFISAQKSHH